MTVLTAPRAVARAPEVVGCILGAKTISFFSPALQLSCRGWVLFERCVGSIQFNSATIVGVSAREDAYVVRSGCAQQSIGMTQNEQDALMDNTSTLITLGTPFGNWPGLAQRLLASVTQDIQLAGLEFGAWHDGLDGLPSLPLRGEEAVDVSTEIRLDSASLAAAQALCGQQAGMIWGGIDSRACWTANFWAELQPESQFLVFFEPPDLTIAHALQNNGDADPEQLKTLWCAGAQQILQLVRRYRQRVLLIDVREAASHPHELAKLCSGRFGLQFQLDSETDYEPHTDTVLAALVNSWLYPSKSIHALCAELDVSCMPLAPATAEDEEAAGVVRPDPLTAMAQYRAVARERGTLATQFEQTESERDRLRAETGQAQQENELLLSQLHQMHKTQGDLESALQKQEQIEQARAILEERLEQSEADQEKTAAAAQEHKAEIDRLREQADSLGQERSDLEARLKQAEADKDEATTAAEENKAELDRLKQQHEHDADENELLLLQLHQVQEELEDTFFKHQKAEKQRADVEARLNQSEADKAQAATDYEAELRSVREDTSTQVTDLQNRLDHAEAQSAHYQEQGEQLLIKLHQTQEQMEQYFLESKQLRRGDHRNPAKPQPVSMGADTVRIGNAVEERPYCHANFTLHDVAQGQRHFDTLDVRLIEHHGEPGLVLFAQPGSNAPLLPCWQETGEEGGRAFMLLHPHHKAGRALIAQMHTSDWLFMNDLLALLQATLYDAADNQPRLARRWGLVCQAVRDQLHQLPLQLRYDAAHTTEADGASGAVNITLHLDNVLYGDRAYPELHFDLRLTSSGKDTNRPDSLVLRAPEDNGALPPLAGWPRTEDGSLAPECVFKFGKGQSSAHKKTQWQALDPLDRNFVTALVSRLPAVLADNQAGHAAPQLGESEMSSLVDTMTHEIASGTGRGRQARSGRLRRVGAV